MMAFSPHLPVSFSLLFRPSHRPFKSLEKEEAFKQRPTLPQAKVAAPTAEAKLPLSSALPAQPQTRLSQAGRLPRAGREGERKEGGKCRFAPAPEARQSEGWLSAAGEGPSLSRLRPAPSPMGRCGLPQLASAPKAPGPAPPCARPSPGPGRRRPAGAARVTTYPGDSSRPGLQHPRAAYGGRAPGPAASPAAAQRGRPAGGRGKWEGAGTGCALFPGGGAAALQAAGRGAPLLPVRAPLCAFLLLLAAARDLPGAGREVAWREAAAGMLGVAAGMTNR